MRYLYITLKDNKKSETTGWFVDSRPQKSFEYRIEGGPYDSYDAACASAVRLAEFNGWKIVNPGPAISAVSRWMGA